jgi:hypothetical protein
MLFIPRCFPAQQQLVQQEADLSRRAVEGLHRLSLDREQYAKKDPNLSNFTNG